jgi:hypothetical protein
VEECLVPTLAQGDIVVMDNLPCSAGMLEACAGIFKSAECTNYFVVRGYDTT